MDQPSTPDGPTDDDPCSCKVGWTIVKYGLDNLEARIPEKRREEGASLRDLADFVNVSVVDAALDDVDADIAGDASSVYDALTGDEVDPDREVSVRNQFADLGVDVDALESDFVSYQAVRTHLRDCLGIDTGRQGITTVEEGREIVASTRERDRQILQQTIRRLQRVGEVQDTDVETRLSPRVSCTECGQSYRVEEFLANHGCDCGSGTETA